MKFELTDHEKKAAEAINQDLQNGEDIPLFVNDTGKSYFLEFKVVDVGKANAFVDTLIHPAGKYDDMIREQCGVEILALNYSKPVETVEIITTLESVINQLKQ